MPADVSTTPTVAGAPIGASTAPAAGSAVPPLQAPGASTGVLPPSEHKPMSPQAKRNLIIGVAVAVAVIALGIVYNVLNTVIFTPQHAAQSYITAVQEGRYSEATKLVNPQVDASQSALMTDAAASKNHISNARITKSTKNQDGSVTMSIAYTLGGKEITNDLKMIAQGHKFGIFKNWTLAEPWTSRLHIAVPSSVKSVQVNGVTINLNGKKDDSSSSQRSVELSVYPGEYNVSLPKNDYYTAETLKLSTKTNSSGTIELTATNTLVDKINKAVAAQIQTCAASTDMQPKNCPFSYSTYFSSSNNYRNFKWNVTKMPTLSAKDIDVERSRINVTYSSRSSDNVGRVEYTYQYKFFGDDWDDQDGSTSFTPDGAFTIDGDKITVEFNESYY